VQEKASSSQSVNIYLIEKSKPSVKTTGGFFYAHFHKKTPAEKRGFLKFNMYCLHQTDAAGDLTF
jgi:hypothetical protein